MSSSLPSTSWSGVITSPAELRAIYKRPSSGAAAKSFARLDQHFRRFIELSPFVCLGTMGDNGLGDVTPRGGEPGFVHVVDDTHLAMPDRPGNNRLDSFSNIIERPGVGLLFFVPGFEDTMRVNGHALITTDATLMQRFVANDKLPLAVLVIEIKEIFLHCGKAIRRAGLWNQDVQMDRRSYPTAGQIYRDQLSLDKDVAAIDAVLEKDARDNLY
jgi:PPOX class probable FMN-dependent enzyme